MSNNQKLRDFTNLAEKDCVRLVAAQDLKEYGIEVDANRITSNSNYHHGYTTTNYGKNTSHYHNQYRHNSNNNNNSHHNNSLNTHNNCTHHHHHHHQQQQQHTTTFSLFHPSSSSNKHHNKSNISTNLMSDLNSNNSGCSTCNQLSSSIAPLGNKRVFGIHLKQIEQTEVVLNDQKLTVPSFLKHAIDFINERIHTEGIFRRNGTASRLKELKKQVEEGIFNFSPQFAIFDVTSLLKLFFRELPESLLTFPLYSNFIQAVKLETNDSKLGSILNLCLQLPDINLSVLIYLMNFLRRITQQEAINKMNSFNLAVCFAPNIIYTKINKIQNDLYINEERIVVQLLIENSDRIGKITETVFKRSNDILNTLKSLPNNDINNMTNNNLTSNSCYIGSTTINDCSSSGVAGNGNIGVGGAGGCSNQLSITNTTTNGLLASNNTNNNDLLFLYDNDENSSFAHHGQSAGSTSLSSYCGSSTSKKEKKKRRSSSLKELMNTIQNSISKFRRRSASEKNDKTTCSIITCSSMSNGVSGDLSCTSRLGYDDKQRFLNDLQTPFISNASNKKLLTPICSSLYATPRINKRNAEDSLQSTTKKKLMEKLPQRNLLLPNAPITPFSTSKKSKNAFKQMLSTSEKPFKFENIYSPDIRFTEASNVVGQANNGQQTVSSSNSNKPIIDPSQSNLSKQQQIAAINTPQNMVKQVQTPATLTNNGASAAIVGLHKQLKYEESPSIKINQSCDMVSVKSKYHHSVEKNLSIANVELSHDCRRRLEMLPSTSRHHGSSAASSTSSCSSSSKSHHHSSSSSRHHHHHHHSNNHYHHGTGSSGLISSSSSGRHSSNHHHHHYVNAIPSPSGILSSASSTANYKYSNNGSNSSGNNNRYINQSDLCTKIISGSYPLTKSDNLEINENRLSFGSSTSSSSSTSNKSTSNNNKNELKQQQSNNQKYHNHTSACCGVESQYSSGSGGGDGNDINSTTSHSNSKNKNSASSDLHQRSAIIAPGDNSMRCTLRRGRPNTPKTGLSVDYRIRKSSVPNTPECTSVKNLASNKINHTISSNDDIRVKLSSIDMMKKSGLSNSNNNNKNKSKSKTSVAVVTLSTSSLNTAMVQEDDLLDADKLNTNPTTTTNNNIQPILNTSNSNLNDNNNESRLLDMAFNEDDIEDDDDDEEHECSSSSSVSSSQSESQSLGSSSSLLLKRKLKNSKNRQLSLSLSNLPQTGHNPSSPTNSNNNNDTSVSDNVDISLKKSSSSDLLSNNDDDKKVIVVPTIIVEEVVETTEQKRDNVTRKDSINCVPNSIGTELASIFSKNEEEEEAQDEPIDVDLQNKQQQQQQNCIQFEPFKFKMPEIIPDDLKKNNNFEFFTSDAKENSNFLDMDNNNNENDENMLQNVLRRQSLFKLKEKINGKVSKHINEIEKRKLSPYRFANSPLKPKKMKESNLTLLSKISHLKNQINEEVHQDSPTSSRTGSIFSRKILKEQTENEQQFINKTKSKNILSKTIATSTCLDTTTTPKIPSDSPLIVRAKNQFYKKFSKNRSVKRLNATMTPFTTNLSSIADTSLDMSNTNNKSIQQQQQPNSPTGKHLISSWKCSTESIDL